MLTHRDTVLEHVFNKEENELAIKTGTIFSNAMPKSYEPSKSSINLKFYLLQIK